MIRSGILILLYNITQLFEVFYIFIIKDDAVIPYELGYKLYQVARESRRQSQSKNPVEFVPFESDRALGHTFIYSAPEIRDLIG